MFKILYHKLVWEEDFKKIDQKDQSRIVRTITKKLVKEPQAYGKPLAGELKGYYRLRIGEFRVIYRIDKEKLIVFVVTASYRRNFEVYLKTVKRLRLA